ncbi:MAG: hypothetical protein OEM97_06310 [Acidimicrobiia bacterium]|nr:hypothetical protein [Acidimicrobiia bacterium]
MAVTVYEQVGAETRAMEAAVYAALDAIDGYAEAVARLAAEQQASADPNDMLIKRLHQFGAKAHAMTKIIEDDVITEMLFCVDRLFAVDLAEKGEFI